MRVINAMFGRKKGAIEQSFINYNKALADLGVEVVALTYQETPLLKLLPENITVKAIANFGQWDPAVSWKLKKIIRDIDPDIIISHGNRAIGMIGKVGLDTPLISVLHNFNAKQINECENIIVTSEEVKKLIEKKNAADNVHKKLYLIPEMIYLNADKKPQVRKMHNPPIIGGLGRFVAKKGFNIFLRSLAILRQRGVDFRAVLGGAGADFDKLKRLAVNLKIDDIVSFPGWVEDKEDFFELIDIFCISSLHEPKSTKIFEGLLHSIPLVTTDNESAIGILRPHVDALIVEAGDPGQMADAIEKLIKNPQFAEKLGREGFNTVISTYDSKLVGKQILEVLNEQLESVKDTEKTKSLAEV